MAMTDLGLFGPDSVAWRLHADPVMLVGGLRALLVQACEPRAMAGVADHSAYRDDPWGRLRRTSEFVLGTTYGDTPTARRLVKRVRSVHRRVVGVDPVTGRSYSAADPDLLLWIHAVEVDSFLRAYRAYAGLVSRADADRYVVEMGRVACMVGLPDRLAPTTHGELREYLRSVEGLRVTPAARDGLRLLMFPPMPLRYRPLWAVPVTAAVAILPARVRHMYRLPWLSPATPAVRAAVLPLARVLNTVMPKAPMVAEAFERAERAASA
jgi:uncharacterized protein (DUF2236 family)